MSSMEEVKLEAILSQENLKRAWAAVKRNDGAAGVDRKTILDTKAHLKQHWPGIREKILNGSYQPAAVRAVEIPKESGGSRLLGIPTVQDRLLQQALHQKLSAVFEPQMSGHSYGFRPNRSARRALESIKAWLTKHLELEVNEAKSGAGSSGGSQLLGFRIHETGDVSIAPKALQRLKERVRQLWDARQSLKSDEMRTQWQRYITGWWNDFGYADWRREVTSLSGWIRRHMRKCFWLRWHNRAGRYNALRRLGVRGRGLNVAGCRRGAWPMASLKFPAVFPHFFAKSPLKSIG